jgi:hypothetical protein
MCFVRFEGNSATSYYAEATYVHLLYLQDSVVMINVAHTKLLLVV